MRVWVHRRILGHMVSVRLVSIPLWDISARGHLINCSCGKRWAR